MRKTNRFWFCFEFNLELKNKKQNDEICLIKKRENYNCLKKKNNKSETNRKVSFFRRELNSFCVVLVSLFAIRKASR